MILRATLLTIVLTLLGACASFAPPDGYVGIERPRRAYELEAVSALNCRYRIRRVDAGANGTLSFWTDAITNELVKSRGYERVAAEPITTSSGVTGHELRFRTASGGIEYSYLVSLVPDRSWLSDSILVVEAGGVADVFEADLAAIRAAVASLP